MHRLILGLTSNSNIFVDHIDGNSLNNTKINLRIASNTQNQQNRKKVDKPTSSKYKGVSFNKRLLKWQSYITIYGKRKHIGYFDDEISAAIAYNNMATVKFGDFCRLNVIEEGKE